MRQKQVTRVGVLLAVALALVTTSFALTTGTVMYFNIEDNNAPSVLNQTASTTNQSVTIDTMTDDAANLTIQWGTTLLLGSYDYNASYLTNHSTFLTVGDGIINGTLYYYNITVCDVTANCRTYGPYNATTLQNVDLVPPVITNVTITPKNDTAPFNVTTDEPTNATVVCSPTAGATDTIYSTTHVFTLSPLVNNTQYSCNVTVCDPFNNCVTDGPYVFDTPQNGDLVPPVIVTRVDGATNQTGTINITISEPANVTITYGTTPVLGTTLVNSTYETTANMTLAPLVNGTLYYYNITACDMFGNCVTVGPYTFTTLQNVDVVPPIQQNVTIVPTNDTATLNVTTDEGANTTVMCSPSASATALTYTTTHSLLLSPLVNNTQYACNVTSCDTFNNCVTSGPYVFTTDQNVDNVDPRLINQTATPTNQTSVLITTYNEAANVTITYGTTTSLGSTATNLSYTTTHSILLSGLLNNTLYYYNITICDSSDNCVTNGTFTFTTSQNVDLVPPVITNVTIVPTNDTAPFNVTTDEPTNTSIVCSPPASAVDTLYSATHSLLLSPLVNNTQYSCNVTACDAFHNCVTNGPYNFSTPQNTDGVPPVIVTRTDGTTNQTGTINITISEPANVTILYGTTTTLGSGPVVNVSYATTANMTINGLQNNTLYYYNITACDVSGNCVTNGPYSFTTLQNAGDTTPPIQQNVTVTPTNSTATLNVTTNEGANTTVVCSPAASATALTYTTTHSLLLSPLVNGTQYACNVTSCDIFDNCATSGPYVFITLQNGDSIAPILINQTSTPTNQTSVLITTYNEAANVTIRYGTTTALGSVAVNLSYTMTHSILLSGLQNNTLYYYNITICDASDNCVTNGTFTFTTLQNEDLIAPIITNVTIRPTNDTAPFNVTTNEPANTSIVCAPSASATDASYAIVHSLTLSPLVNNTQYSCNVTACDAFHNCATNGPYVFTTPQNGDSVAPRLIFQNATATNDTAILITTYNEAANITIKYGTSPSSFTGTATNLTFSLNHSTIITGLLNNTLYYYNITICDVFDNCNTTGPYQVTTGQNIDTIAPLITNVTIRPTNDTAPFNVTTNEPANASIVCTPPASASSGSFAVLHQLVLSPLTNNTQYACNVTSCDSSGNCNTTGPYVFVTLNNTGDVTAPLLISQTPYPTNQSAIINVTFNEPANITIRYGATIFYGGIAYNTSFVINQSIFLGPLLNNTLYYYNITFCDAYGNCQTTGIQTFITLQNNDTLPPVQQNVTITPTNGTATLNITTDEAANTSVVCTPAASAVATLYLTTHSILLSPLINNTLYACNVTACDIFGNCATTGPHNFTTSQNTDNVPPLAITQLAGPTNQSAIINVTFNEPANITIRYGTTITLGGGTSYNTSFGINQSIFLGPLVNNTLYYYNITACDVDGNCQTTGIHSFKTLQNNDTEPPRMTNVTITPTNQSATINVTTSEQANTSIECVPAASGSAATYTLRHSIVLSPLINGTLYSCNITACDRYGNCNTTGEYNFTTLQNTDGVPPLELAHVDSATNQSALVNVTFNEPANVTINYGTSIYLGSIAYNTSYAINQSIYLAPLINGTIYYYNITACDMFGNCKTTGPHVFATLQNSDYVPPFIQNVTITPTNQTAVVNITTDEAANTSIVCTPAASATATSYTLTHSLLLSPLVNNTLYSCNITACDVYHNCNTGAYNFTTLQNTDTVPPVQLSQVAGPTNQSAIVNITLDEPANITIRYGTTTFLGSVAVNTSFAFNQSVYLGPLVNNTLYYYNITACDAYGNCKVTGVHTFTTLQNVGDIAPPAQNVTITPTNDSAPFNVTTSEPANTSIVCTPAASASSASYVTTHSLTLTPLVNNTEYSCNVTSCDPSGNCNVSGPHVFVTLNNTVDSTPPVIVTRTDGATNQTGTINVTISEPANVTIRYGTTTTLGGGSVWNTTFASTANLTIVGLQNGTLYYYNITVCDSSLNCVTSGPFTFTTLQNVDTLPPMQQNVSIVPTNESATLNVTTDEGANTSVVCAPAASATALTYTTTHSLTLSPLVNNTQYACNVTSCDTFNNCVTSGPYIFVTLQNTDTIQPVLITQTATPTNETSVLITTYNEAANVTIRYGTTTALGSVAVNLSYTTTHDLLLTGLQNNTLYYYNITICDASDNCVTNGTFTFTTLQNVDLVSPHMTNVTITPTNQSATVNVTTDEQANKSIVCAPAASATATTYIKKHSIVLSPLINGTQYSCNITACDKFGNCNVSGPYVFTTLQNTDSLPPMLITQTATPTNETSVLITTYNEAANVTIRYGTTTALGSVAVNLSYTTTHDLLLTGLQNNTLYYYNITICDASDNCVTNGTFTFMTGQNVDIVPPVIVNVTITPTNDTAPFNVTTSEPTNATLNCTPAASATDASYASAHSLLLSPLVNNTQYSCTLTACDMFGNCNITGPYVFVTLNNTVDISPPILISQTPYPTNQSAIINVTFNEPANITIRYGTTIFFGGTAYNASFVINQSVFLGPLVNNTLYYYNITACDAAGNCQTTGIQTFITLQNNDTVPPVIINVTITPTNQSATVNVTTDEQTNKSIVCAPAASATAATYVKKHSLVLSPLINGTQYICNITACDVYGNCQTDPFNFTTLQNRDNVPPVQLSQVAGPTNQSAIVNITLDEPANITIRYGTTTFLGSVAVNTSFAFNQSVFLGPLVNNTLYYYNITACDVYGNCKVTGVHTFTTLQNVGDITPPVQQNVTITPTNDTAPFNVTTNEPTNTSIVCTPPASATATSYALTHSLTLAPLVNNTLYSCNVTACDLSGNCNMTGPYVFVTLNNTVDSTPPVIVTRVDSATNQTGTINITISEPANVTIRYGTTTTLGGGSVWNTTFASTANLTILGLQNGTLYYYNITVCDTSLNCVTSGPFTFTTLQNVDFVPPIQQNVSIVPTNDTATLNVTTDEGANTTVVCSPAASAVAYTYMTTQSLLLSPLVNNTQYACNVTSCDFFDNCVKSGPYVFTTLQNSDTVAPILLNQTATPTNQTSVVITTYNEAANVTLRYGTTPALGSTATNLSYTTTHSILLLGLLNNTLYYYNITICDASDNCVTNGTFTFSTLQNVDLVPPVIINVTITPTNDSAPVNVTTSEPTNATLNCTPAASATDASYASAHSLLLSPLVNNTQYACTLTACDMFGNCNVSGPYVFTTPQNEDNLPPILITQTATPTNETSVVITTYNEAANVTIEYGTTPSLGSTATNLSYTTTHDILLTGLLNNTLYYYNITICDSSGNCATNGTFTFTTLQNVDLVPPVITNVTIVPTNDTAPFNVTTDEPTNTSILCTPSASATATSYALTHSLVVSPLVNNTQYSCNVTACDTSGNCATSGPYVFTTPQNVDALPPILITQTATPTNETSVVITTYNEAANVTITYGTTPLLGSTATNLSYTTTHDILLNGLQNGTLYYYNITICDSSGNCVTNGTFTFTTLQNVDLVPPVITDVVITPTNDSAPFNVTTNEPTNTSIVCSPPASATATSYALVHSLTLSPLVNNTQYDCNVTACDSSGNCVTNGTYVFMTDQNVDDVAPIILTRVDGATNQTATINVTINEPANVTITYGTTPALGSIEVYGTYSTYADMLLLGLTNGTLYYYNITACDVYGNCVNEGPYTFTTLQNGDLLPPIQQNVSVAPTNDSAIINVTTDEGANTTVVCSPTANAIVLSYMMSHSLLLSPLVNNTQYACNVTSCDTFGNCATSGPYVFTTLQNTGTPSDTTPPTVTLLRPSNGGNISSSTGRFNFTATDDNATALTCTLLFNSTSHSVNATSGMPAATTLSGLTNGTYWWNVSCSDGANTGTSATWVVIVNITIVHSGGGGGGGGGPPIVNITPQRCVPDWLCSDVGGCVNGIQQRDCIDFRSCNNDTGRPPLTVPCVVPPQPPKPPVTPGQPGGAQGGSDGPLIQPEVVAPAVPVESVQVSVPVEYVSVFLAIVALSLLVLATGAVILMQRRKEDEENFYGVELEKDTTYVHYDLVVEALQVLEKLLDGQPVDDHTPFVQVVCREALDKAQRNLVTARIPRERLDGHVDWVSAELYSRVVEMLAAALIADVPITITDDGHLHVVAVPGAGGTPAESYIDLGVPAPVKMPISQMIIEERWDVNKVLEALRESETMLMLDIRYTDAELKRFMKAVKKTVDVHNGAILAVGDGKYIVTSGIPIDTSSYLQPQDDAP